MHGPDRGVQGGAHRHTVGRPEDGVVRRRARHAVIAVERNLPLHVLRPPGRWVWLAPLTDSTDPTEGGLYQQAPFPLSDERGA